MNHILGLQTLTFVGNGLIGDGCSNTSGTCSSSSSACTSVTSGQQQLDPGF